MKVLFISCFVLLSLFSFACLNEHHVSKTGKPDHGRFFLEHSHFYKKHNVTQLETYIKNLSQSKSDAPQKVFENQNSIAVALIKLGRLDEAETILNELHQQQPKDYSVVANLGTLYELQGKNEKALEYIKRSMQINPDSHEGSEWFHVKVLEFKLKNIPEDKIATSDILGLGTKRNNAAEVANQIKHQLQERIPFMPAPNMLVAKILDEYAGYLADNVSITGAYLMYSIGEDYDRSNIFQFVQKKEALKPYFKKYKQKFPVVSNYYSDPVAEANTEKTTEIVVSALDNGINFLNSMEEEKLQKEKQAKQKMIWITGIGLGLAGGLGFYLLRRRNKNTANIA